MFRTFQLLARRKYLGEIRVLRGTVGGKKAPTNFPVQYLKYASPLKGFRPQTVVVEGRHQFPVRREGDQWEWVSEPPPGWITGRGIPYDLEEALRVRDGRPYGFDEKVWGHLKENFLLHARNYKGYTKPGGKEFPKDFFVSEERIKTRKEAKKIARIEKYMREQGKGRSLE